VDHVSSPPSRLTVARARSAVRSAAVAAGSALAFACALLVGIAPTKGGAQAGARALQLNEELRLDLRKSRADAGVVAIGPAGEIMLAPAFASGNIVGFDSTGHDLGWKIAVGVRDAEIRWVTRIGWFANTMWIVDPGYRQVVLSDERGQITTSLEHPNWVRPTWADRRKYPVFGRLEPVALYPDGSWLIRPSSQHSLISTPGYDTAFTHLLRIGADGVIRKTIARVPRDNPITVIRSGSARRAVSIPYKQRSAWQSSVDGRCVVIVMMPPASLTAGKDTGSIVVTAIGERGDTIYSRALSVDLFPLTPQTVDSIRDRNHGGFGGRSESQLHDEILKLLPAHYPPVGGVVVGRDGTAWIELRREAGALSWLVLDGLGKTIGFVSTPAGMTLRQADRDHVWATDAHGSRATTLVRYRVGVAKMI
jgi:hypothetical protein